MILVSLFVFPLMMQCVSSFSSIVVPADQQTAVVVRSCRAVGVARPFTLFFMPKTAFKGFMKE